DQQSVGRLSRMDAMQIQAMARESERRRLDEIQAIRTTLNRIAAGEYGYCVGCGEQIAPARLVLIPTTGTCVDCADRAG
ncbi:MAG: molecular chaperone DnaK, partial [Proteobacteria bacterium]|nr:molecular chaperone DnaK [Pseudomonadota bacterium]